jgi:hypothetical protein
LKLVAGPESALSEQNRYFAQASEWYFTTIDFPGFFGIKPSGSTHFPGIQNFALTVPEIPITPHRK